MFWHTSGGRVSFFTGSLAYIVVLSCPKRLIRKIFAFCAGAGGWLMFDDTKR